MRGSAALLAAGLLLALTACSPTAGAARTVGPTPAADSATAAPAVAASSGPQDPDLAGAITAGRAATPVRVVIPAIGVDARLLRLARDGAGRLEAPPPDRLQDAGWYAKGTLPGRIGPAVVAGHVDWVDRVAVFHRLGELRAGDRVVVVMSDRSRVAFTVDRVRSYAKDRFPTRAVYGPTPGPQLRVITCGGPWDDARNIYSRNVVVFASRTP